MNLTKYQYYKEDIMYKPASIMIGNKDLIKDEVISAEVEEVKGEEDIRICSSCGVKFKGLFKDHECSEEKEITKKEWMNDNINFMKRKSINEETYKQFVVGNWNMDKLIDSKEEPCTNVLKETMKETIEKQKRIFEDILLKREEEAKKES